MGGMLSRPITSKMLMREGNAHYRVGRTDMQGYRLNMEDDMTVVLGMGVGREDWAFFGVFDGHAGALASEFLGKELHMRVCALPDPFDADALQECVCKLDSDFCSDPERRNHGSTCVFAIVRPTNAEKTEYELVVSNTGDSRVAIIRKDTGECVSMTSDHKPEDPPEHARIIAAGGTVSMNRTDGQLAMSRAIGDYQYKKSPELPQDKQKVIPRPDITFQKLVKGDTLLVMCDGIVEQMTNSDATASIVASMKDHNDPAVACAEVFTLSLDRGSKDNHSAIVIVLEDGRDYGPPTEFVAGPYHPFQSDKQFSDLYLADAARYGLQGEELFALARKTEADMDPMDTIPLEPQTEGAGQQYMRLLEQIQKQYNLQMNPGEGAEGGAEEGGGGGGSQE